MDGMFRPRFSLRALLLVIAILCMPIAVAGVFFQQEADRRAAWSDIRAMGFRDSISVGNNKIMAEYVATKTELTDAEIKRLVKAFVTLGQRHDFGMSDGVQVILLDVSKSRISDAALAELRQAVPNADIRH